MNARIIEEANKVIQKAQKKSARRKNRIHMVKNVCGVFLGATLVVAGYLALGERLKIGRL